MKNKQFCKNSTLTGVFIILISLLLIMPTSADSPAPIAVIDGGGSGGAGDIYIFSAEKSKNTLPGTTYEWNTGGWGEPSSGTGLTFSTIFNDNNVCSITLKVTNPDGQCDTAELNVCVLNYPAKITSLSAPETVCIGETFEATASVKEGGICEDPYSWNWGNPTEDEGFLSATGSIKEYQITGSHKYTKAGVYTITFTYIDDFDSSYNPVSETRTITVKDSPAPIAVIDGGGSGGAGDIYIFSAEKSKNTLPGTTYEWNTGGWGEPSSGTGLTFSTIFNDNNVCSITLKVTNPDGQCDTAELNVCVLNYPAKITSLSAPETVYIGETFEATASVKEGGICEDPYSWNWGNPTEDKGVLSATGGIKEYQLTSTHKYTKEGEYTVTFGLDDDWRNVPYHISESRTITVRNTPDIPAPEFPTVAIPAALIIGLAGIVLMIRQRE